MVTKPKGGDDDSFDFSKYGFGKRGSKGFNPSAGKKEPEVNSSAGSGGSGDGDNGPSDFGNFDWEPEPNDEEIPVEDDDNVYDDDEV